VNDAVEPTAKGEPIAKPHINRSKWRSLRDFVDEPAIEEALERMESDRNALEVRSVEFGRKHRPLLTDVSFEFTIV
jgi:hypothetical protein